MRSIVGVNGTMELHDDRVVLTRGKMLGNLEKTTYLRDVIEVKLIKPGLTRGLLSIATAIDSGGVGFNASVQANSIALKSKQWDEAVQFKQAVDEAVLRAKGGGAGGGGVSEADELTKFKKLLDDGVITAAEFEAKKKQILGI